MRLNEDKVGLANRIQKMLEDANCQAGFGSAPCGFAWRPNVYEKGKSIEHLAPAAWATKDQLLLPIDAPTATGN